MVAATGCTIRCSNLWVVRSSDLVFVPFGVTYYRVHALWGAATHPVYGTENPLYASVWRYRKTAENFIEHNGLIADIFYSGIKPTGEVTSDDRQRLVAA